MLSFGRREAVYLGAKLNTNVQRGHTVLVRRFLFSKTGEAQSASKRKEERMVVLMKNNINVHIKVTFVQ